jgi:AcrR family transcriptional regulator
MEELIIDKAKELFFFYGVKSVSMDDLARAAGISKKTIYQHFSDKTEVLDSVVNRLIDGHYASFINCHQTSKDAIEEVVNQSIAPFNVFAGINYGFFHELEKSFPLAWEKLMQYREKTVLPAIIENLQRGIYESHFRADIDVSFVAQIRLQQLNTALNPAEFGEAGAEPTYMMNEFTSFFLHGITSDKGRKLINKYLKNKNESYAIK